MKIMYEKYHFVIVTSLLLVLADDRHCVMFKWKDDLRVKVLRGELQMKSLSSTAVQINNTERFCEILWVS